MQLWPPNNCYLFCGEMIVARTIAWSDYAQRLKPPEAADLHMLRPPSVESRHHAVKSEYSSSSPASCLVHLIVARYKEDVSWLNELPPRVSYHVMQKDALQPEMPPERQTQLTNVGRESHSYLSYYFLVRCWTAWQLPPLLVCCQGNPFEHNQNFLSDVAAARGVERSRGCCCNSCSNSCCRSASALFVPLGIWSGGHYHQLLISHEQCYHMSTRDTYTTCTHTSKCLTKRS